MIPQTSQPNICYDLTFRHYTNYEEQKEKSLEKEHQMQEAILKIKNRYGKNAILKGVNFQEGATGRERNRQVGGHKA